MKILLNLKKFKKNPNNKTLFLENIYKVLSNNDQKIFNKKLYRVEHGI